ncbi:glycosyltransferase family 2 protein [Nocardioides sp. R1-1]|uniref:glycosyltransferase family 2 protein n=1 Tax=Nocardioides sp. R1-1 TaxID=3383502 RepID=UPI0038D0DA1D
MPSVSIVIPAFRNARFIDETVDSALAQTYEDLEVVIADHSSDDGTWELLQRYADHPRVRLLRTPAGGGAPANWNAVTHAATGTYLKLLCGDDLIAPTCVEKQVAALQAHPTAVAAAARRDLIDPAGDVLLAGRGIDPLSGLVPGPEAIRALVRAGTNLLGEPGCVLIRREVLERVGGWLAPYPYLIDQFTYMSVLEHGDLVALPETLASFRVSDTQWSVRLASEQSRQAAGTHRHFRERLPETVTRGDVALGNARARMTALMRRAAYVVWRKRMKASA